MYISSILGGVIILGIYYKNMYNTAYLPINSSSAFTNNGTSYSVQAVITDNTVRLFHLFSTPSPRLPPSHPLFTLSFIVFYVAAYFVSDFVIVS